jgi:hypothetical protein
MQQEIQTGLVRPVEVLDNQQRWVAVYHLVEGQQEALEQLLASRTGLLGPASVLRQPRGHTW